MENLFFPDQNGPFDIEDFIPDDPWIDDTALSVQNLEIPEPNVTAREVLEETILSPAATENWLDSTEDLDQFFPEKFIDLAAIESNMNSFNTDPYTPMPNFLDNLLVNAKEDVQFENAAPIENIFFENVPSVGHSVVTEVIPEFDSTAVVPNVVPEMSPQVSESPIDCTDATVFASDFSLDMNQLDPSVVVLLKNLEKSVAGEPNVPPKSRKRVIVVEQDDNDLPTKKKPKCSSSSEAEPLPDKIVERRIKNNAASRVCRATRKARHEELFQMEKELVKENKELSNKVEELTATVKHLRSYLVNKLRCN